MKTIARTLTILLMATAPVFCLAQDAAKPANEAKPATEAKNKQADAKSASSSDAKVEPEAEKLHAAAKEALKKVRDISYKVKQKGGMGGDEAASGAVAMSLPEKAGMGLPFDRYKIAMHDEKGATKSEWANDGKKLYKIDPASKKLLSLELKDGGMQMPPSDIWPILPQWVMEDRFENPMMKTVALRLDKDAEIGGVKCRVLSRVQEMEVPDEEAQDAGPVVAGKNRKVVITTIKHLGAEDMLPRKIEMTVKGVNMGEDGPDMSMLSEMSDLKANTGLKDADFALKAPEGYASEAGTYENMGLQDPNQEEPQLKAEAGKPAIAFKLKDPTGKEFTLEGLKGRVVLLDFWATWCGPCKKAMPSIQKLHEKFADKAVSILGVNCWEKDEQKAIKYMESQKFTYGLLLKGDDLAKEYGISGIPTLILIGKDGNVLHAGVGFGPGEEEHLAEMIQKELDKK